MVLNCLIRQQKVNKKPLGVVVIDFAKAFDSVAHTHLWEALRIRQVDSHMISLLKSSYETATTKIACKDGETEEIPLRVGVK